MKDDRLIEMRIFRAVAESGGFTAASLSLDVSQSYVSKAIVSLERRLGVALLRRSTRRMTLTDEGIRYLDLCQRILGEIESSESALAAGQRELSGDIRLTVPTAFGMDQIVPMLPAFLALHPKLRIRLSLSDIPADLIGEGFDLAIRMGLLEDSGLIGKKLCHLQRVVVAAPSYLAAHGTPKTPDDLQSHNCLMWEPPMEHMNRWPFMVRGRRIVRETRGNFQASTGMASVYLCLNGVGITRMGEHMVLPFVRSGQMVPLLSEFQAADDTSIYALFPREAGVSPRVRAFIDYVAARLDPPPWIG